MAETKPKLREYLPAVTALWSVPVLAGAYEILPASTAPILMDGLGVDATAVSWLISVMFAISIVASVPSGLFIDSLGKRVSVAVAAGLLLVAGVGSWYFGRADAYWALLGTRVVAGLGFVIAWNAGLDVFGGFENPATATSVYTTSGPLGFVIGHLTGPLLADAVGWELAFAVYPLALVVPGLYIFVRFPAELETDGETTVPSLGEYGRLLANRQLLTVFFLGFISYSLYMFVNSWMPTYLNTELGISIAASGALVALFPFMGGVSRLSGGVVTDRLFGGRRRPVVIASFAVSVPLLLASFAGTRLLVVAPVLVVLGFFVQLSLGLIYSFVPMLVPDELATTGVSLLTSISLGGSFSAPIVVGFLIEATDAYSLAFGYAVVLAVVGIALGLSVAEPSSGGG